MNIKKRTNLYTTSWEHHGSLIQCDPTNKTGVYILVLSRPNTEYPPRVVYVGTATGREGFKKRWKDHLELYQQGGRTVWRPDTQEDLYSLMSVDRDNDSYDQLASENKLWLPGSKEKNKFFSSYFGANDYEDNWLEFVLEDYLPRLDVWSCVLAASDNAAFALETFLQRRLGDKFEIGYYDKKVKQNWFGRQELSYSKELEECRIEFTSFPPEDIWPFSGSVSCPIGPALKTV